MGRRISVILVFSLLALAFGAGVAGPAQVAPMATWNIENFPREASQPRRAAEVIGSLGVPIVAVQEIRSPGELVRAVHDVLGSHWDFVTHRGATHRVGLLVDTRRYLVTAVRVHDEPRVVRGGRPALEVEVRRRAALARQSIFVVHLKSGPDAEAVRRAQLKALAPIVAARDVPVTVLGDFNPVWAGDRRAIDRFALSTGTRWNSVALGCTAYFPDGGRCRGVALDHVTSSTPGAVRALGACATVGCEPGDRCPTNQVSDHCPVVFSPLRRRSLPTGE